MKPTIPLLSSVPVVWASLGLAQPAPQQPSSAPQWHETQLRDAADTYTFTRFTLIGKFVAQSPGHLVDRPVLTVDCIPPGATHRSKLVAADLRVGSPLAIVYVEPEEIRGTNYFPEVAVRYRMDNSGEDEQRWPAGTDYVPSGRPSDKSSATVPANALKRMLRARTVAITVNSDRGSPVQMQFEIPDPAPVAAACAGV
jgi:hypothetical protein